MKVKLRYLIALAMELCPNDVADPRLFESRFDNLHPTY